MIWIGARGPALVSAPETGVLRTCVIPRSVLAIQAISRALCLRHLGLPGNRGCARSSRLARIDGAMCRCAMRASGGLRAIQIFLSDVGAAVGFPNIVRLYHATRGRASGLLPTIGAEGAFASPCGACPRAYSRIPRFWTIHQIARQRRPSSFQTGRADVMTAMEEPGRLELPRPEHGRSRRHHAVLATFSTTSTTIRVGLQCCSTSTADLVRGRTQR